MTEQQCMVCEMIGESVGGKPNTVMSKSQTFCCGVRVGMKLVLTGWPIEALRLCKEHEAQVKKYTVETGDVVTEPITPEDKLS